MDKIKVIIVDDHNIISDSLSRMINLTDHMEVLTTCCNGEEAVQALQIHEPDLILMDAVMPKMNGVEATKRIKAINSDIKILMLTTFSEKELILNAFEAGIDGYLLKETSYDNLVKNMNEVMDGSFILPSEVAIKLVKQVAAKQHKEPIHFNRTEEEIIELLKEGHTNKEISQKLNISYGTTRNYISDIYMKVGEKEREKAVEKLKKN